MNKPPNNRLLDELRLWSILEDEKEKPNHSIILALKQVRDEQDAKTFRETLKMIDLKYDEDGEAIEYPTKEKWQSLNELAERDDMMELIAELISKRMHYGANIKSVFPSEHKDNLESAGHILKLIVEELDKMELPDNSHKSCCVRCYKDCRIDTVEAIKSMIGGENEER